MCWKAKKGSSTSTARRRRSTTRRCCGCNSCPTQSSRRIPPTTPGARCTTPSNRRSSTACASKGTERVKRLTIAILFGGCSEEHDVSVKSATEVATSIDTQKYEPIYIGIARSGVWKMCERPSAAWEDGDCRRAVISPDRATHGLLVTEHGESRAVHIDAVFPVLHGKSGEDGAVQGLLELSGIPYVGCDIQSSAICMDKSLAYVVARDAGIDTPAFSMLDAADTAVPNEFA